MPLLSLTRYYFCGFVHPRASLYFQSNSTSSWTFFWGLIKKENGRKSIEQQKIWGILTITIQQLFFQLFFSICLNVLVFWDFQVKVASSHIRKRREKKRDGGMMDEVSSLRTGRNSVYCVFAVDCDDDLMDRIEKLYINSSCCCWTSRSIDVNKMMAKQISIDAIFLSVHINQIACDPSDILRCARQLDVHFYFFFTSHSIISLVN